MKPQFIPTLVLAGVLLSTTAIPGTVFREDFATDPISRGWIATGDTNLFAWNPSGLLEVTWDSSRPNSYYALPLGQTLTAERDFSLAFDLYLEEFRAGIYPQQPNPFQLALGLLRLSQATDPGFLRGTGFSSPNLVDFSFFPDPGEPWMWGPSITAAMTDGTGTNWATGGFGSFGLETGKVYRVSLQYDAVARTLAASVLWNGAAVGTISPAKLGAAFQGLELDHFAICSYSGAGQDPAYAGSLLARGWVDNLELSIPDLPWMLIEGRFQEGQWRVTCTSLTNRFYALERTDDFQNWSFVADPVPGTGSPISLTDTNAPGAVGFYRVRSASSF